MAIKFNPQYVDTLAKAYAPQETVVASSAGVHKPIWALGLPFFFKTYLFIATDRRLLVVEHRRGLMYDRIEKVERFAWSEIASAKVAGLLLKKSLKLTFTTGRAALSAVLPGLFGPIAKAKPGAQSLVDTWQRGKALPSTPAPAYLPSAQPSYASVG
ncbi:MAG: hypothetical protein KC619_18385 [Myxococcales bacterium]|nr:hypothetical protein [Myxococcales bacterium]